MSSGKFSIEEAVKYGWNTYKANVLFFFGFMVAMTCVTVIPDAIVAKMFLPKSIGSILSKIALRIIGLVFGMMATRISLDLYDTGKADLKRLQDLFSHFPAYFAGKFLYGLMVLIGLALLIVPGIIVALMFLYVGFLIIDRGLGPIEALQESRALTEGVKMDLFLLSLVVMALNVAGFMCLFVGLFISLPVTMMASVYVYRQLSPAPSA